MHDALVQSCDVYFYRMGEKLGVDRISRFAKLSGFGGLTGIDLPHEKAGIIPSREWKLKRFGERWTGGENLNLAIGQGYTVVSPLQVARFIAALVNGGRMLKPSLLAGEPSLLKGQIPPGPGQARHHPPGHDRHRGDAPGHGQAHRHPRGHAGGQDRQRPRWCGSRTSSRR